MNQGKNLGPLLIILAVLTVAVGVPWLRNHPLVNPFVSDPSVTPSNFVLERRADPGTAVSGFPSGLVDLAKDASIKSSALYRVTDARGDYEALSATYDTAAGIADLFAAYVNFLTDRGYTIVDTESQGGITRITSALGKETTSVSIYVLRPRVNEVRIDVKRAVIQ